MPLPEKTFNRGSDWAGVGETALTLGTGAVAEPLSGLAGLETLIESMMYKGMSYDDALTAAGKAVEETQQGMTYEPRSESGRAVLGRIGDIASTVGEPIDRGLTGFADNVAEKYGPEAGALVRSLPAALAEVGIVGKVLPPGLNKLAKTKAGRKLKADQRGQIGTQINPANPEYGTGLGHGSPSPEEFTQFLDEYMGSGEGGQAVGWGHYLSEAPGVQQSYASMRPTAKLTLDGDDFDPMAYAEDVAREQFERELSYSSDSLKHMMKEGESPQAFADRLWPQQRDRAIAKARGNIETDLAVSLEYDDVYFSSPLLEGLVQGREVGGKITGGRTYDVIAFEGKVPDVDYRVAEWQKKMSPADRDKMREIMDSTPDIDKDSIQYKMIMQQDNLQYGEYHKHLEKVTGDKEKATRIMQETGFDAIKFPTGMVGGVTSMKPVTFKVKGKKLDISKSTDSILQEMWQRADGDKKEFLEDLYFTSDSALPDEAKADFRKAYDAMMDQKLDIEEAIPDHNYVVFDPKNISIKKSERWERQLTTRKMREDMSVPF